jgi:bacteriocin-like protein
MTISISNLENCLEELSDEQMQQISGGLNLTGVVSSSEARNRRSRNMIQDVGVGAATNTSSQTFSHLAQDPTTRRI